MYKSLPEPPEQLSAQNVLIRFIDAIGFRFFTATDGLTQNEFDFRPVDGSMNMTELLDHMFKVFRWSYQSFGGKLAIAKPTSGPDYIHAFLEICQDFKRVVSRLEEDELSSITVYLKRTNTNYSVWYLINGPIADVLTHIGQINSWRRIAGNPIQRISPFTGEAF